MSNVLHEMLHPKCISQLNLNHASMLSVLFNRGVTFERLLQLITINAFYTTTQTCLEIISTLLQLSDEVSQ